MIDWGRWTELNEIGQMVRIRLSVIWKRMSEIWDTPTLQIGVPKTTFLVNTNLVAFRKRGGITVVVVGLDNNSWLVEGRCVEVD